jgi:hypothetical protein
MWPAYLHAQSSTTRHRPDESAMYEFTVRDPAERRAAVEYRVALITRDYRRLRPVQASWWQRRRRNDRAVG